MLGRNRSAAFDSKRIGSDVSGRGKLASFARKFQRKSNFSGVASEKVEEEILVSTPTRNVDFVNKLKAISREHVVEAVRSRSLETRSDVEQGTVTTVDESVESIEKLDRTTKREEDDRESHRATDNILQWAEHMKLLGCGACEAMPWSRTSREDPSLLRKKLSLTHKKRSAEHIQHHWEAVLEDDRDEVDKMYSPPFDFDMDKTSESRVSTIMTDDSSTHGRGLTGNMFGYHPKYSMSYGTGAETTEFGDGTSYASSLYSSFASEPGHFDDSTTITTNY